MYSQRGLTTLITNIFVGYPFIIHYTEYSIFDSASDEFQYLAIF